MLAASFSLSKHTCLEKKGLRLLEAQPPKSRCGIKRGRGRAGSCSLAGARLLPALAASSRSVQTPPVMMCSNPRVQILLL